MTAEIKMFAPGSRIENAYLLASHLPQGRVWSNAFISSSNFGLLVSALAMEFYRLEVLGETLVTEMDIDQTNELIIEWEKSVGIPNSYFETNVPIEDRRAQVKQLFTNFGGVQTGDDLVRVAAFLGFTITVAAGASLGGGSTVFPLSFPLSFSKSIKEATHTIYITIIGAGVSGVVFPLVFPLQFSIDGQGFLRAIFEILIPANVQIIYL